jgi:hypothetical protein
MDNISPSPERLLDMLAWAGRTPSLSLIRACLARQAELTPGLLAMFAASLEDDWKRPDDPRWYRGIHAGRLLIAFRAEAALPIFATLYRSDNNASLLEWFDTDPSYYGPVAIPTFVEVINHDTRGAYHYGRSLGVSVLGQIALQYPEARERVLSALRAQLPPLKADGSLAWPQETPPEDIWGTVVTNLGALRDEVSQPVVLALFERGWVNPMIIQKEEYQACFAGDIPSPLQRVRRFDILQAYRAVQPRAAQEFVVQRRPPATLSPTFQAWMARHPEMPALWWNARPPHDSGLLPRRWRS